MIVVHLRQRHKSSSKTFYQEGSNSLYLVADEIQWKWTVLRTGQIRWDCLWREFIWHIDQGALSTHWIMIKKSLHWRFSTKTNVSKSTFLWWFSCAWWFSERQRTKIDRASLNIMKTMVSMLQRDQSREIRQRTTKCHWKRLGNSEIVDLQEIDLFSWTNNQICFSLSRHCLSCQ